MIPIHCSSIRIEEVVLSLVGDLVEPIRSWDDFESRASSNSVAMIAIDRDGIATAPRAELFTRLASSTRFALVIDDVAIEYDLLGRLTVWKVVPLSHAARTLRPVVLDLSRDDRLAWVVANLSTLRHVPSHLRAAIRIACLGPSISPTVAGLAAQVGCSRKTLSDAWRRSCGSRCGLTFDGFLAWTTLLRALAMRSRCKSWEAVGIQAEVSVATLRRLGSRLTAIPLAQLEYAQARELFVEAVLMPITPTIPFPD